MINKKVQEYIDSHSFCSELLLKDWEAFLDLLYAEGGRVSAIQWWDRCRRTDQHLSVGGGGYVDQDDPAYMYAEVQLLEDGFETKSLEEVKQHIAARKAAGLQYGDAYASFDLVPSFYLCD